MQEKLEANSFPGKYNIYNIGIIEINNNMCYEIDSFLWTKYIWTHYWIQFFVSNSANDFD